MFVILFIALILLLAAAFSGWYFDPDARKAAEKIINEMMSSEPDEHVNREWW